MMTSKERAALRSQANTLECVFWIGKDGITENFVKQVVDIFNTRELIKISVQVNSPQDARSLASTLAEKTQSEVVQVLGRKITLYKYNEKLHEQEKQKKKAPVKPRRVNRFDERNQKDGKRFYKSGRAKGCGNAKSRWKNKGID